MNEYKCIFKHWFDLLLSCILDVFCLYLPALHSAVPWHQDAAEVFHFQPNALPSYSPESAAERRHAFSTASHTPHRTLQIWNWHKPRTNTDWHATARSTPKPSPHSDISVYPPADQSVFSSCILQITGDPLRSLHELTSALISTNVNSGRKSC